MTRVTRISVIFGVFTGIVVVFAIVIASSSRPRATRMDAFTRTSEAGYLCAIKGYGKATLFLSGVNEGGIVCSEPMGTYEYLPKFMTHIPTESIDGS